ncbi:unnamed protein product, partial [marine sediment metagenome]
AMLKDKDDKMIFYDEIHQGSGSKSESQNAVLSKYVVEDGKELKFPFIMVTATFLKPMLKYGKLGGTKALILQWTYDMMQNMKKIAEESTQKWMEAELLSERDKKTGEEKAELFKVLLKQYQKKGYTLDELGNDYKKEPELAIICPSLNKVDGTYSDDTVHTGLNIKDIFDIEKITKSNPERRPIQILLNHIKHNVYGLRPPGPPDPNAPRNPLIEQGFNVLNHQHSQLWFLPTNLQTGKKIKGAKDEGEEDNGEEN